MTGASASCFGERFRDLLSQNSDVEHNSAQISTDCCTVVCKQTVQLQYDCVCVYVCVCVCVCHIQFAGYTSVYAVLYLVYVLLRQGSVTGVILVGRSDSLGFHSVTWLVGF